MSDRKLERDEFAAALNSRFRLLRPPDEQIELELISVSELISARRQEMFSIVYRGPGDIYLPQQIYHLEHEQLGSLDLFLVPIGKDDAGYSYEAVFNRLKS